METDTSGPGVLGLCSIIFGFGCSGLQNGTISMCKEFDCGRFDPIQTLYLSIYVGVHW